MIALELSGVHVHAKMRITYRFKSWKKDKPEVILEGYLNGVRHQPNSVMLSVANYQSEYGLSYQDIVKIPFDATVELLD